MTNKEILQADMLDILFEHRNKLYGAYALRKTYAHRLSLALGVALSTALLLTLMSFMKKGDESSGGIKDDRIVKFVQVEIPKPDEPKPPVEKQPPKPPQAEVDYQKIIVVADDKADTKIASIDDVVDANIGDKDIEGAKPTDIAGQITEAAGSGNAPVKEPEENIKPAIPDRKPEFPGGTDAWLAFLRRYLQAPEDIEPGQRIEVQVRFLIDIDGNVSKPEIVKSGGSSFDKEVLRVLKKMPRWEPAIQGGRFVAVPYTQPVIFIGEE